MAREGTANGAQGRSEARCSACGAKNTDAAKFCKDCGAPLAATDDRANTIIAVVLMAIFLTWIACAIAVWAGWAI